MIWIPAALCAAYNIAYIVHCLKFKRFRAAVGMALLAPAVQAAAAVAIFFFINVTDDEPPFRQTQIFNK